MLIADQESIKDFKTIISQKNIDRVEIIIDNYLKKKIEFHRIFLQSGFSMGLEIEEIKKIINILISNEIEQSILLDLNYILHIREIIYSYKLDNFRNTKSFLGKLSIDDLFNTMEVINFIMITEKKTYDNTKQKEHILRSQYNNLLDSFPELIELIQKENIITSKRKTSKFSNISVKIIDNIGRHSILKSFLLKIFSEHISPTVFDINEYNLDKEKLKKVLKHDNIYFLNKKQSYWQLMEIYRDLSYRYFLDNLLTREEEIKLMEENKVLIKNTKHFMHFDLTNHNKYYSKKEFAQNSQVLNYVFDLDVHFEYENKIYKLKDLIDTLQSVINFSKKLNNDNYAHNSSDDIFIKKYDKNNLSKKLEIPSKNIELLNLLTYDLNDSKTKSYEVNFKYLIKKDNFYFILPFWIEHIEPANFIDKIVSSKKIKVLIKENQEKGYKFEKSIREIFDINNIPFHITNRDNKTNIPEIDGMFELGNYLFLIEAKAIIKSSSYMEMYNTLNSTLKKAHNQLLIRVDQLKNDSNFKNKLQKEFGINVSDKEIVPLILLTNPLFNGYKELKIQNTSFGHIPIIDFLTLKHIISSQTILSWKFNNFYKYESNIIKLNNFENGKSLVEYLHNQITLESIRNPQVQLLDEGIMYSIISHL